MSNIVIVGSGDCPPDAVKESLIDALSDGDTVTIAWPKAMNGGIETILGYLLDNGVSTTLLYSEGQNVHPSFRASDTCDVVKVKDTTSALIKAVDGEVLIMWDDNEFDLVERVFDSGEDVRVRELSNGLSPIVVEYQPDAEPAPVEEVEEDDDEDDSRFTREQLEDMAVPAVKRYGEKLGCSAKTKSGIIEELFGAESPADDPVVETPSVEKMVEEAHKVAAESELAFAQEMITLIGNFYEHYTPGFETDMAHLALGQARLWMLRSLTRMEV